MHSAANDCKPTYVARNLEVDSSVLVYLFNNVIKDSGSLEFSTQSSLAFDFHSDGPPIGVVSPDFSHSGF